MRIALLAPTYWPEVRRGSERIVHDLGSELARRGHEIDLLTSHRGRPSASTEDGIRVVRDWRVPEPSPLRFYERYLTTIPAVGARLLAGRYDVAHAFFPTHACVAALCKRAGGPPFAFSIHGVPTREYLVARRYRLEMIRAAISGADAVTVLSRAAAEPLRRYLRVEPEILPGAVDCRRFAVDRERAAEPTLICAASLGDPRKRGALLLDGFARLRERRPEARLVLAGGADMPDYAGSRPMPADGVTVIDADRTDALADAYATAWASVLPAVGEAFGLVLVESLAAGTPVVASRSGAVPELLTDDGIGSTFDPDDADDLSRAMDDGLRLGAEPEVADRCRARAAEFDLPSVTDRVEALYRRIARR
ncbi:MAG: glycosyltransferase family 4 protein [Solirubrobacterales bacterium]